MEYLNFEEETKSVYPVSVSHVLQLCVEMKHKTKEKKKYFLICMSFIQICLVNIIGMCEFHEKWCFKLLKCTFPWFYRWIEKKYFETNGYCFKIHKH